MILVPKNMLDILAPTSLQPIRKNDKNDQRQVCKRCRTTSNEAFLSQIMRPPHPYLHCVKYETKGI